MHKLGKLE